MHHIKQSLLALCLLSLLGACKSNNNTSELDTTNNSESTIDTNANTTEISNSVIGAPIELDKAMFLSMVADFEKNPQSFKYLGDKPAIVDFYASWCGPCKQLAPILDQLAKTYEGQIYIYKVNTDEQKEIAAAFGIQGLPSLLYIPIDGKPTMFTGLQPIETLDQYIQSLLLHQ